MVSFFHGQNDGQKGVGLIMMILIAILPSQFSLDAKINLHSIDANVETIAKIVAATDTTQFGSDEFKNFNNIKKHAAHYQTAVLGSLSAGNSSSAGECNILIKASVYCEF